MGHVCVCIVCFAHRRDKLQQHHCIVGSLKEISEAAGAIKTELWMLIQRYRVEAD